MNPLKKNQVEKLNAIGFDDLARKVDELVRELNKIKKLKENFSYKENSKFDEVVEAIFDADTLYDAKEILLDYVEGLK